jgi:hypothetical protein
VFLLRFNRDFELIAGIDGQEVFVKPPMRISFDGNKSVSGGLNKLTLKIYNLKDTTRKKLVKDPEEQKRIPLILRVGYKDRTEIIFKGTIHKGENSRSGVDHITTIECLDGGFDFLNSFTSKTVKGKDLAVNACLSDMPNTQKGKITTQNELIRPKVLVGNSVKLIEQQLLENETWFIDEEKLYIVKNNEIISSFVPVVSAETGLLNTPQRQNQKVTFETMLNPSIKIAFNVQLISANAPHLNGVYRIESIGFKGDNYGSDWSQSITGIRDNDFVVI